MKQNVKPWRPCVATRSYVTKLTVQARFRTGQRRVWLHIPQVATLQLYRPAPGSWC
jgi:hypothetical protein